MIRDHGVWHSHGHACECCQFLPAKLEYLIIQSTDLASVVGDNYMHMNCFSEEFREYEAMSLLGNSLKSHIL